uniref:Uncharacterized protein n=1 Tax=Romanomermis culicivorax TaxID=13658 RepID=A0A915J6F2_ROMCU
MAQKSNRHSRGGNFRVSTFFQMCFRKEKYVPRMIRNVKKKKHIVTCLDDSYVAHQKTSGVKFDIL